MQHKRLDDRIAQLIDSGLALRYRSMFILLGVNAHKQIPVLFQIYQQKALGVAKIAWCYADRPSFKKQQQTIDRTLSDGSETTFMQQSHIRFTHYRDVAQLLGQTFQFLVLQDFEALTPNVLAQTIETVAGGGIVLLLLNKISSLGQLRATKMALHRRYQSATHGPVVGRFNERFHRLLRDNQRALLLDEQLGVVELGAAMQTAAAGGAPPTPPRPADAQEGAVARALLAVAITHDQSRCLGRVLSQIFDTQGGAAPQPAEQLADDAEAGEEEVSEPELPQDRRAADKQALLEERKLRMLKKRNLKLYNKLTAELVREEEPKQARRTAIPLDQKIFVKANRGRGKSALLGLAIAGAISQKATNVLIFAPQASNVQTVFQFIIKGLAALNYQEFGDYQIVKSDESRESADIIGIDVFKEFKQVIRFVGVEFLQHNTQAEGILSLADLIVIDEAAAIKVNLLEKLLAMRTFTLLSSTVHGYEGSGRVLQVKVVAKLQKSDCNFIQLDLQTPIRYAENDGIERWLYQLLLLDCEEILARQQMTTQPPLPADCSLCMVSRDALFCGEPAAEKFLQLLWGIFTTSHYKNQPNDLILLSDGPNQRLFILLGPIQDVGQLPIPLAVVQVALEGQLNRNDVEKKLFMNQRDSGDMVPWVLSQQFLCPDFSELLSARIVRIAANPFVIAQGYGSKALQDLYKFFSGKLFSGQVTQRVDRGMAGFVEGQKLPPLLFKLTQLQPDSVHYTSVSYGLNHQLYKFWSRNGYKLVYLAQNLNQTTNEHSCIMVHEIRPVQQLTQFSQDFQLRFYNLCDQQFRDLNSMLLLKILTQMREGGIFQQGRLAISSFQVRRLEYYYKRIIDFSNIADIIKQISMLVFLDNNELYEQLSIVQKRMLAGVGVQRKTFAEVGKELGIDAEQAQAIFSKAIGVIVKDLKSNDPEQDVK